MKEPTEFPATVRTTQRPDAEIQVDRAEFRSLKRRGYLYEGNATTDEGARRSVEADQKKKAEEQQ